MTMGGCTGRTSGAIKILGGGEADAAGAGFTMAVNVLEWEPDRTTQRTAAAVAVVVVILVKKTDIEILL